MRASIGGLFTFSFVVVAFVSLDVLAQDKNASVAGHVEDAKTDSSLAGVNIVVLQTPYGTTTDSLGNFSLVIKPGKWRIQFSRIGYESETREISAAPGARILFAKISLKQAPYVASEVMVNADRKNASPSIHTIEEKDLDYIPNLNSDVIRSVTILPGVISNNELTSAYNVRGQNFDANLIYLDGYEIYRPYLVQQGIEENQSAINENMVQGFEFYNGAFPVEYGDKMSSVLVVNYKKTQSDVLGGEVNADLLNLGATMHDRIGRWNWIAGFRYSYPSSFMSVLQTKGTYLPNYTDFQLLTSYVFPNDMKLELLFITAKNSFNLTPQNWIGDFLVPIINAPRPGGYYVNRDSLSFNGTDDYRYDSNLLGLKLTVPLKSNSYLSTSFAYYSDEEFYNENLSYDVYFAQHVELPHYVYRHLETGYRLADNSLDMRRFEVKADFVSDYTTHGIRAGVSLKSSLMNNVLDESTYFVPAKGAPYNIESSQRFTFNSISAYLEEYINLSSSLSTNLGVRGLKYYFNGEFLVSPRASVSFHPDSSNSLNFGWGYYYQPPYFYETRDKSEDQAKSLGSQRAIHYVLRYENNFKRNSSVSAEVYYKDLSKLLPYSYTNQLELTYGDTNNYNGYAYGFDLQYQGELSERLDTWVGYDYLVARERRDGGPYQRSLLDQTHTIRIFLQDAMPMLPNSQAHVRLLFGTGYLYHPLINAPSTDSTISAQMVPDYTQVRGYPFYFRVDMGLTYKIVFDAWRYAILSAEVLNVFNNRNVVSYSWYNAPEFLQPVSVPNLLSLRYFNVGVKVELWGPHIYRVSARLMRIDNRSMRISSKLA